MKTKLLALILALTLTLSLAACGGKDAPAQDGAPGAPEVSTPEDGETAPAEEGEPNAPSTSAPGENCPNEPGAPAESESQEGADLAEFYNTLRQEYTWPELMSLTEDETMTELLDSYYPGLSEISTKQCGVYTAAISAAVGEIALVEVENAEDVQAVKDIFQARIDYMVGDGNGPGGAQYPMAMDQWENNSRVVSNGNYVMMIVHENCDDIVSEFNALF